MYKAIILLLLVGCTPEVSQKGDYIEVSSSVGIGTIHEIHLKDNTRCIVLMGYSKGSITCDWRK